MVREVSEGEINDKRTRPSAYSPVIVTEEADEELVDCAAYEETGTAPASSRLHRHKIEIMRFNIKKTSNQKNDKKMKYLLYSFPITVMIYSNINLCRKNEISEEDEKYVICES